MPLRRLGRWNPHGRLVHPSIGAKPQLRDGRDRGRAQVGSLLEGPPLPLSDWELWACANEVFKTLGDKAPLHVAERLGALSLKGDEEGIRTWQEIARRNEALKGPTSATKQMQ